MNARDKSRGQLIQVDRRANSLNNELEECKMSLELADRSRRNAEQGGGNSTGLKDNLGHIVDLFWQFFGNFLGNF